MLTIDQAATIIDEALAESEKRSLAPLCVVVLDAGGHDLALKRADGAAHYRVEIARTKAAGCLGMGMGGRDLQQRANKVPGFYAALAVITSQGLLPMRGGVLVRDGSGEVVGAVGISGDTGENDEVAALAGIAAASLVGEP